MKKSNQEINSLNTNLVTHNSNLFSKKIKTTNVNVLLNRVRLDKKKDLRKKIIFVALLVFAVFFATFFALI